MNKKFWAIFASFFLTFSIVILAIGFFGPSHPSPCYSDVGTGNINGEPFHNIGCPIGQPNIQPLGYPAFGEWQTAGEVGNSFVFTNNINLITNLGWIALLSFGLTWVVVNKKGGKEVNPKI